MWSFYGNFLLLHGSFPLWNLRDLRDCFKLYPTCPSSYLDILFRSKLWQLLPTVPQWRKSLSITSSYLFTFQYFTYILPLILQFKEKLYIVASNRNRKDKKWIANNGDNNSSSQSKISVYLKNYNNKKKRKNLKISCLIKSL